MSRDRLECFVKAMETFNVNDQSSARTRNHLVLTHYAPTVSLTRKRGGSLGASIAT